MGLVVGRCSAPTQQPCQCQRACNAAPASSRIHWNLRLHRQGLCDRGWSGRQDLNLRHLMSRRTVLRTIALAEDVAGDQGQDAAIRIAPSVHAAETINAMHQPEEGGGGCDPIALACALGQQAEQVQGTKLDGLEPDWALGLLAKRADQVHTAANTLYIQSRALCRPTVPQS